MKTKPQLKNLRRIAESDYKLTTEDNIGICEVKGNSEYRKQEDAITIDASDVSAKFMAMPAEQRKIIAEDVFKTLQDCMTEEGDVSDMGSCACVSTGQVKDGKAIISTSYVGDSVAILVVLKADGTLKFVKPCNPNLHDGFNANECLAIKKGMNRSKGFISNVNIPRLYGELAVTRALGDTYYDDKGISHIPETTTVTAEVAPDDRVYMVVTCDGAMEHCKGKNSVATFGSELGKLFEDNHTCSPEVLAEKIVDHALEKKSLDNITAIVVPLKKAVTAGVFDGHGGCNVSNFLSDKFNEVFKKKILSALVISKLDQYLLFKKTASPIISVFGCSVLALLGFKCGAVLGGTIGSVLPGPGTAVGAIVGASSLGVAGGFLGMRLNKLIDKIIYKMIQHQLKAIDNHTPLTIPIPNGPTHSTVANVFLSMGIHPHSPIPDPPPVVAATPIVSAADYLLDPAPQTFKIIR